MSRYRGMTNEQAADQYAHDQGIEQEREAYIERLVEQDLKDLREFGFIIDPDYDELTKGKSFNELVELADPEFSKNWMYENFNVLEVGFECKERVFNAYKEAAFDLVEKYLYEQYRDAIK